MKHVAIVCCLCGTARFGARVDAGPELVQVHRDCFAALDARSEALEHEFGSPYPFDANLGPVTLGAYGEVLVGRQKTQRARPAPVEPPPAPLPRATPAQIARARAALERRGLLRHLEAA